MGGRGRRDLSTMTWSNHVRNLRRLASAGMLAAIVATLLTPVAALPVDAVAPGTNGRIVFASRHDRNPAEDLYTIDSDGTNLLRITNDPVDPTFGLRYVDPAWSPNGAKIAAFRYGATGSDLVIMNADGSSPVVHTGVVGSHPSWTPDGLTIFFEGVGETAEIWKIGANGTGLTKITGTGTDTDTDPSVNPAGTKLAFVRNGDLVTSNLDGTGVAVLAPGTQEALNPSWSPDGTRIAFGRTRYSYGVWLVNANGTGLVQFIPGQSLSEPAWSPDGQRLVVRRAWSTFELATASLTGCTVTLFAPGGDSFLSMLVGTPDWQPVAAPSLFRFPEAAGCIETSRGTTTSTTRGIIRSGGFTGPVTLSASNVPANMTVSISPNPATGSSFTLTIKTNECPNPTEPGTYRLRITGVSGATTRVGYADVAVDDGSPRMTAAPSSTLAAGRTVSTASAPVVTTWAGCDGSNPVSFIAQRWKSSVWSSAYTGTAHSITQSLAYNTTYRYRAKVEDAGGGTSAYSTGPYIQSRLTQQNSTSVKYRLTWATRSSSSYLGESTKSATTAGASASYTFTGSSIAWVGAIGPTRGSARVFIDGVLKATVNTYSSTSAYKRTLYVFNWSSQGTHTIKVVVVGTAGHARVDVDGFVRIYRP